MIHIAGITFLASSLLFVFTLFVIKNRKKVAKEEDEEANEENIEHFDQMTSSKITKPERDKLRTEAIQKYLRMKGYCVDENERIKHGDYKDLIFRFVMAYGFENPAGKDFSTLENFTQNRFDKFKGFAKQYFAELATSDKAFVKESFK